MQKQNWQVADPLDYELLKVNAKENRRNMTDAESIFWQMAKGSGLGEKCRRQYVIGDYIVDFFFRKSMLIVEIDGGYHTTKEQQLKDVERQDWLEHNDYRVLRFTNVQVLCDIDNVITKIKQHLRYE
jgi:very-short-patch-repair endonuclease